MFTALALTMFGNTATAASNKPDGLSLAKALDHLTATEDALDRTRREYRQARDGKDLDANEAADFKGFIVALDRQVHAACDDVRRLGGDLSAHAAYCARTGDAVPASLPGRARTRAEVAAEIDSELDASVGEFDEMLLREQRALAQHAQSSSQNSDQGNGSSGAAGSGSSGDGANAGEGGAGTSGSGRQAQGSGPSGSGRQAQGTGAWTDPRTGTGGDTKGTGRQAAGGTRRSGDHSVGPGTGGMPADVGADIPDGHDDDVVARQLREAAMKEQDPELRRRLWEEYKRYKQGKGSNQ